MHPDEHNPLGYGESDAFYAFHEGLLHAAGSEWDAWTRFNPAALGDDAVSRFTGQFRVLLEQEFGKI